ncbi:hypothetical protein ALNOE001_11170 [Candidatus Methanobinarius endosymbioticus]|uniref:Glycosyltransferase subfamily 4-like N-terminal domain-containing protein n=1 Tax=Candidatus Methanobinarius endosymbioticus TaxID=2006182 RepID=A0A366MA60_9EURY|nr:hypothetical protein ALNOE001_11170 [Candidatus Methanobinarius endosymbioticus]
MKKVLLIAFYFNQTNEIASKRLRGLAKYLSQFGWEPIVVVPKLDNTPSYQYSNLDFKSIETDYEDMLDKWINKFKRSSNNKQTNNNSPNNKDPNPLISKAASLVGEIFAYPDGMKYWYEPAMELSKEVIEINNIEAIISSSWPVTSHIIAKDLKKEYNLKWIADLRDLWNLNPYVKHTFIRNHFEKKLEIETFRYADVLTTTTELSTETLQKLHPNKQICTVMSGYDIEDITENNIPKNNEKLNFTYAGSLYGGKRDPNLLFKGIKQLIDEGKIFSSLISLDFYGDNEGLENLAKEYNIEEIVNIHGSIPHKEVLEKQKETQALLLLSWNNKNEKMFLPGKIYEYLAAKRPVLSIGYKEGSLKDLIEKTNIGYHVSTLEQTKEALMKFYNSFIENNPLKYTGNQKVNNYSIISTAQKFGKILDSI